MGSGDTNFGTSPLATIGIGNGTHISIAPAPTVGRPGPPTRISQGVSAGLLIAPIQPLYPPIAIAAHQQGTVMVQAIISKSGQIESAHVLSGPTMLQGAALDAVRRARYRPFLLNNEPTEVETTISINFHLGN
jgi:protein TonB